MTEAVARLAAQDEARHVAFGMSHLARHADRDPILRARLTAAVERRHDALADTAGLNEEVFDSLVIMAAGSWQPEAIARGYEKVQALGEDMHRGGRRRLEKLGFSAVQAGVLAALHTRNFM